VKRILLLICFISTQFAIYAQKATIAGKVTNVKNETLVGVTIQLKGDGTKTVKTDVEGRYTFDIDLNKLYSINFSYVGYKLKTVVPSSVGKANEVQVMDVLLEETGKKLTDVVVSATRSTSKGATDNALIAFQKNTNTIASVISAESIKRSPDRNTAEILKRTPGASIQEGKFIIVRGLADRYNQAMLNGILLTSTEPDRKTFSFDLFPSQIIDNIIINKAFVPELPGEWAGGLIQVNTKDIPTKNFFNIQVATSANTLITGKDFFKDKGGKTDWYGVDDGSRSLPTGYTTKSNFDTANIAFKTALGKAMPNNWTPVQMTAKPNISLQMNGGFSGTLWGKKIGGILGINYAKSYRLQENLNRQNTANEGGSFSVLYDYQDDKYIQDINMGAIAGLSIFLNPLNKISYKAIVNVKSNNAYTDRSGEDFTRGDLIKSNEFVFGQNVFFTNQLNGEHSLTSKLKLNWFGAFNILDSYSPDQRRIMYTKNTGSNDPYVLNISNTLSQQSGSRVFQDLSDYIYTAGGDLTYKIKSQTIKAGYLLQIKDRLYDAKLFANFLPSDNAALRAQGPVTVFAPQNFGNGTNNLFGFDAIKGRNFRYMANTILNAGFLQFDNKLTEAVRVVWGLRVEDYDQLIGSVKKWDPRHTYSRVTDYLPGINTTIKINQKSNLRLTASQTVIRPELRELSALNIYDFELNASVQGNPLLKRTKITNTDLRYEFYPSNGELLTLGAFYKDFAKPIEQIFNEGAGGSSTFTYQNAKKATTYGLELEMRKKLTKRFTLQANGSLIKSSLKDSSLNLDRPLQGQSPYLINMGLLYDIAETGFNATILFNQVGERIYLVGDVQGGASTPNIYEAPRALFDFQMSKKFAENKAEIKITISDILNQKQTFYQNNTSDTKFNSTIDAIRFQRRFGTTFGISLNYSL
jgi:outer membrane receptor for ferrienterochelin and colicin